MDKLLTIVIAAYNMEKLLPRCLDSLIINPELQRKVQVLVVNDGSKDRTSEIAKEYEAKFPGYILAIDQTNGNYGKVMNNGLSIAEGKYFRTLDADDWYDTEAYSKFVEMLGATDADMIITEKRTYHENTKTYSDCMLSLPQDMLGLDLCVSDAFNLVQHYVNCLIIHNITYKTEIVRKSGLRWLEHICYTDTMFDFWPLPLVKTVRFVKLPVYIYLLGINDQSMSPVNVRKNFMHFYQIAEAMVPYFLKFANQDMPYYPILKHFLTSIYSYIYGDLRVDDKNLQYIIRAHKMLDGIPAFQRELENTIVDYGCNYIANLSNGTLPIKFRIIRYLRKLKSLIK